MGQDSGSTLSESSALEFLSKGQSRYLVGLQNSTQGRFAYKPTHKPVGKLQGD